MADPIGSVVVRLVVDLATFGDDLNAAVGAAGQEAAEALTGEFDGASDAVEGTLGEAGAEGGRALTTGLERAVDPDIDVDAELAGLSRDAGQAGERAGDAVTAGFDDVPAGVDAAVSRVDLDELASEAGVAGEQAGDAVVAGFDDVPAGVDAALAAAAPDLTGEFAATGAAAGDALAAGFDDTPAALAQTAAAGEAAVAAELEGLEPVGAEAGEDLAEGVGAGFSANIDEVRSDLTRGLAVVAAAVSAALIAGVVESAQLDAQLREVVTLFGETGRAAEESLGRLQPQVRALSSEIGFATEELTGGLYNAISAGVPEDNVFEFLRTAGEFAVAGVTDTGTAIEGLTSATNAFNLDIADATDTADTFFAGVQAGKTTVPELSQSLFNVAPAASAAGLALDETVAAVAALTSSGVPTSVATTQIRSAIVELADAGSDVGEVFEQVAGVTFRDFIASGGDLAGALDLIEKEADSTGAKVGDYFGSVEAAAAAQTLATDASGSYSAALEFQAERAGAAAGAFDLVNESAVRQFELLKVQAANIASSVGDVFIPVVEAGLSVAVGFGEALGAVPEPMLAVIAAGGTLTAIVAAVGAAALVAGPKIAAANLALIGMGGASGIAMSGLRGLSTFLLGPWGLATAAAAAGLYAIHAAATAVDEAVADVNETVREAAGDPVAAVRGLASEFEQISKSSGFAEDVGRGLRQFLFGINLGTERAELFAGAVETAGAVSDEAARQLIALAEAEGLVRVETDGSVTALSHMGDATALTGDEVANLTGQLNLSTEVTENMDSALRGAIIRHQGLGDALDKTGEEADEAGDEILKLSDAMATAEKKGDDLLRMLNSMDGGYIDLDQATADYVESVEALIVALGENGATYDTATQAGRDNLDAIEAQIRAGRDHIAQLATTDATLGELDATYTEHVNQLRATMIQMGFTAEEADALIARYGLLDGEFIANVRAEGIPAAEDAVSRLQHQLNTLASGDYVFNVRPLLAGAEGTPGIEGRAHGGNVEADRLYLVGEEGPELVRFDHPGEVFNASETAAMLAGLMAPSATPTPSGPVSPAELAGRSPAGGVTFNNVQHIYTAHPQRAARESVREIRDAVYLGVGLGDGRR